MPDRQMFWATQNSKINDKRWPDLGCSQRAIAYLTPHSNLTPRLLLYLLVHLNRLEYVYNMCSYDVQAHQGLEISPIIFSTSFWTPFPDCDLSLIIAIHCPSRESVKPRWHWCTTMHSDPTYIKARLCRVPAIKISRPINHLNYLFNALS